MPNVISLHRRLDRIDGSYDELHGLVESLERVGREHKARQALGLLPVTLARHPAGNSPRSIPTRLAEAINCGGT